MRPLRNQTEYPAPDRPVAKADDVREAIPAARAMVDMAGRVIEEMPAYCSRLIGDVWLPHRSDPACRSR